MKIHVRVLFQVVIAAGFMLHGATASADLLSYFNFNNSTPGSPSTNMGNFNTTGALETFNAGTKTISPGSLGVFASSSSVNLSNLTGKNGGDPNGGNFGTFAGSTLNALGGDPSGGSLALSATTNNGKYVQFQVPTLGYEDLVISYATRNTSTGFQSQAWSYSTDGSTFNPISTISGLTTTFAVKTVDLSGIPAADNQSSFFVRVTFAGATSGGSDNGNNRIDNVQFNATAAVVPEPSSLALAGIGGLGTVLAIMRNRRRSK